MPVMLMRLRGVPEDEASEIRELLEENRIEFYETPAGNWGVSMPSIWMHDEDELPRAKALLEAYQEERGAKARAEYEQLKRQGKAPMLWHAFTEKPVQLILTIAFVLLILYISTMPFLDFGK